MKFMYASGAQPVQGYTIRRGVGRGGFGEVYQATSDGGKEVALKLVQRHLDVELRGVGQCLNLKHPNLVVVHDILKAANDDAWIVMEYIAGESLDQVLARHPRGIPEQESLAWLQGVCEGVGYLHDRGLVHRDLKPGNLFVENGTVKVGDYGLSKFISASRRSGHTESVGTVHYMAPETSRGRYGKEVDQYALGVILYEMLTGRPPFDGESVGEILMKHLTADPDLGRLPEAYRPAAARLLNKDPQRRYPSVRDLLAALPEVGFVRPSAVRGPAAAVPGTPQPGRAEPRTSRPKGVGSDHIDLIHVLMENGMDADDVKQLVRALGAYTGQGLHGLVPAVRLLVENGVEAAADIEQVVRALGERPEPEAGGMVRAVQVLVENGMETGEDIARVVRALGADPEQDLPLRVKAVQGMVENGMAAEDVARVLRALGARPEKNLYDRVRVVQKMVENGMDAGDVERALA